MIDTKAFYDGMVKRGMDFFVGVPDSLLANLCACIKENAPGKHNIIAANEGNAVAIAAGYHIATGKYGVVYMQNSGQGNAVNPPPSPWRTRRSTRFPCCLSSAGEASRERRTSPST